MSIRIWSAAAAVFVASTLTVPPQADAASRIKAVVNKVPITSNDVKRRAAFLKLRRLKGNLRAKALDELIEEQLKMQEARRLRVVAKDDEVEAAYRNFAKQNKIPMKAFERILRQSGATPRGFKSYIRAQMSWQRAVMARYGREARSKARPKSFTDSLKLSGKNAVAMSRFTLQQIVFVVPKAKGDAAKKARLVEARRLRNVYPGCAKAKTFARGLRDVSVIDKGRMLERELPPNWKKDIQDTAIGKTTRPKVTEKGVELIAVCDRQETRAADFGLSNDVFQKRAPELDKKYYADLKKKAKIVRR